MQLLRESDNGRAGKEVKRPDKKCDPKDYLASRPSRAAPRSKLSALAFGCPAFEWQTPSSKLSAFVCVYPASNGDPKIGTIGVCFQLSRPPEGKRIIFLKKGLTNGKRSDIIIKLTTSAEYMRQCWNWQTGTFEGRVLYDVRVQVPFAA